jgi:acyl-CoA dehydrogenase
VDFNPSDRTQDLAARLERFLVEEVYPAEPVFYEQISASGDPHRHPQVMEDLKAEARSRGLWNLFLPHRTEWNEPLSNLEYAPLAELTGRSLIAPEALNSGAPDTGNMELLTMFGTDEQKEQWLKPLLNGDIRSTYIMTEPAVASSDASNISTRIEDAGDHWLVNGHKWWISGPNRRDRCKIAILLGVTDPDGEDRHRKHSMVLIPLDTPGVEIVRDLDVFGYNQFESHTEMTFTDVRVPKSNLLGEVGAGFAMSQARLGPGRIHHCMRQIGAAERAVDLMVDRAENRVAFGQRLIDQGVIREMIAKSRIEIDQARLYVLYTAWLMDTVGNKEAASQISGIKVAVPRMAGKVIDRAIQVHGAGGLCEDFPLARLYAESRIVRIADGPDEVHLRGVARAEVRNRAARRAAAAGPVVASSA